MKYFIILTFLFSFLNAHTQTTIKSQVITSKEKEPLGFVHIFNKNTKVNTLSDTNGWFYIQCKNTDTIVVRFLGYRTRSLLAFDTIQRKVIELSEDTIMLGEVLVSPENAYKMLLQARDSTNKHQMKSFQGKCLRQDKLSLNGHPEKKSEAEIIFVQKRIKHESADVDYWLNELKLESFEDITDLPRVELSNIIPLNTIKIPKGKINYRIILNSDSLLIINAKIAQVSGQLTNENNYFIDKNTWIIKGIECKGNFRVNPLRKGNFHFFQTDTKFTYNTDGDSCTLSNYTGKFVFSHKKVDLQNLWEYFVNMDIIPTKNTPSMTDNKKLRPLDFLLYKNEDQKSDSKHK